MLDIAEKWLKECCKSHHHCGPGHNTPLPLRVLELGPDGAVRLYETRREAALYACLSYCWGPTLPLRTTLETYESHKKGIPENCLAPLYRNAISFVRGLNIKYLWIDSLVCSHTSTHLRCAAEIISVLYKTVRKTGNHRQRKWRQYIGMLTSR